ncbi:GNAT family N-acetyltransferase [Bacillus sp. 3103sda1]|uniref:GNAT family N-acetyltransferase n=1 Tax=unclassified Bacillus (in: firmicutes) TaxID=185979 RepID=UPI00209D6B99|nr:GNAT family N-acetyltransferase [Bacillus sp. 3103sda1]MCP1123429.1 GNAT family N-acetyltransferase [Bacillus sp. 3103sda1]
MYEIKSLGTLSFEEATNLWNAGFEGYFIEIKMTMDAFLARMTLEELSPSFSLVAFYNGQPVGIILNGIRMMHGKKIAWNGGTGVVSQFRYRGVGGELVRASLELYKKEGVDIATLEAISKNDAAIHLYKKMGYEVVDQLLMLQHTGILEEDAFQLLQSNTYHVKRGTAQDIHTIQISNEEIKPWQTEWMSVRKDGELLTVYDDTNEELAYFLYKKVLDQTGKQQATVLYQCYVDTKRLDQEDIVRFGLSEIFSPLQDQIKRMTMNLPSSNEVIVRILKEAGFIVGNEQVFMVQHLSRLNER